MRAILEIGLTKVVNKYLFHKSAAKYDRFVQHPELINMEYSKFSPTQKSGEQVIFDEKDAKFHGLNQNCWFDCTFNLTKLFLSL